MATKTATAAVPMGTRPTAHTAGVADWLGFTVLVVGGLYFLFPLWWVVVSATKTNGNLFVGNGFWFTAPFHLLQNIQALFTYDGDIYGHWLLNSLFYAVVAGGVGTFVAVLMGYALAKYEFTGRQTLFYVVLASVLVPQTVLVLPLYLLFSAVHLTNTVWAVLVPSLFNPFGVYLARIYAASTVPDVLIDAGRIDGADEGRIFFRIALPQLLPALVTIFAFQAVAVWNSFFLPLIMLDNPHLFPVVLGLDNWNIIAGPYGPPDVYAKLVTGSLISLLPLAVGFFGLQRYLRSGLGLGALSG
jgi:multiple sugar transport system permease protein